jgi:AraC family transcriptional regulator
MNEHLIAVALTSQLRIVHQFDDCEYEGKQSPGEFFLLPAGIPAFWHWEIPDESLALTISPEMLSKVAAETECLNPDRIELRSVLLDRDPQLEAIARSFQSEMTQVSIGGRLYTESLANILSVHLLRHYCTHPITLRTYTGGLGKKVLQQVLDYIQANIAGNLSLNAIAQEVNISQYHFISLFKQSMGMTPHQYVIQQRIERAKELLRDSPPKRLMQPNLSISEIGFACGFANQSHFTRLFRKHTGVTPKAYRER